MILRYLLFGLAVLTTPVAFTGCGTDPELTTLHVAVASNFRSSFEQLRERYEKTTDLKVVPTYGSSGMLAAQISQGAPFELFLSADRHRPEQLTKDGNPPPQPYTRGQLVFWAQRGAPDPERLRNERFAMANPELAPYGNATLHCLQQKELWTDAQPNAVFGSNISQTYQFVHSEAVQLGFVAHSQVLEQKINANQFVVIASTCHPPIAQYALVLPTANAAAAQDLLNYLLGNETQRILAQSGYEALYNE